jgi:hypothetical protein
LGVNAKVERGLEREIISAKLVDEAALEGDNRARVATYSYGETAMERQRRRKALMWLNL